MAVPEFELFLHPVLKFASLKEEASLAEMRTYCQHFFNLTHEDISEVLESGKQTRFANRVQWSKTYLQKANLLCSVSRGVAAITESGKEFLKKHPNGLTITDLKTIESFRQFSTVKSTSFANDNSGDKKTKNLKDNNDSMEALMPPNEQIEQIIVAENQRLAEELLNEIVQAGPKAFEQLVLDVIRKMGYGVDGRITQYVKDGGVDGVIKEDRLGLSEIYLQAKLWEQNIGSPAIQQFIGALTTNGVQKGIFITNSDFSQNAIKTVQKLPNLKVILINGKDLVRYMIQYGVGTQVYQTYELKKIDKDYFESIL